MYEKMDLYEQVEREDEGIQRARLDIGADYYALCYVTFIEYYRERYTITNEAKSIYIVNVVLVFSMQFILILIVYYYLTEETESDNGWLAMMHFDVVVTRLICAFLQHMLSEPEVRQAIGMMKYVLNHSPARITIQELYKTACGSKQPVPDDPTQLNDEVLTKAFHSLKQYQIDEGIYCRHDVPIEIKFLLQECGKKYVARLKKGGKMVETTLLQKWLENRTCTHDTFNRDELYAILKHLGVYFPGKKADYLFFQSNQDNDTIMSCDEFIEMWRNEQDIIDKRRRAVTDYLIKVRSRGNGICSCVTRLFRPNSKKVVSKAALNQFQSK